MPYRANALYSQGVPTYAGAVSPLADVFKALAPNPLRQVQIESMIAKSDLDRAKVIGRRTADESLASAADAFERGDYAAGNAGILRGGVDALPGLKDAGSFTRSMYAARGLDDPSMWNQHGATIAGLGAGDDYERLPEGFEADQSRRAFEAAEKIAQDDRTDALASADRRYGHELSAGASRYGADQRLIGTKYTADNKTTGRTGGGGGKGFDPIKVDDYLLRSLPGSFLSDKGKWAVDPSIQSEALQDVRSRQADYLAGGMPIDQATARSVADVFGEVPTITPAQDAVDNWGPVNTPAVPQQVIPLPRDQRGGRAIAAAAPPGGRTAADIKADFKAGRLSRDQARAELQSMGYD